MSVSVTIEDLTVDIGSTRILHGIDLDIPAGSFVTLLGPSGSGKTTTLNVLAGFLSPSGGHVKIDGNAIDDIPPHKRNLGFLFQNYALFPHMTVGDNIAFPLRARKVSPAQRGKLVEQALDLVKLPGTADRAVGSLSGGQAQRIALARALVFQPSLLLLDEPLAALDKQLREAMQLELKRIQDETGTTTFAVTHDQVEAMSMADLVAIMNEGRVVQVGSPEDVYRRPATLFVAQFLGEANFVPVASGAARAFACRASADHGIGVVRPEDIDVVAGDSSGAVSGRLETVVFQGARRRLTVAVDGLAEPVIVSAPPEGRLVEPGERIGLRLRGDAVHTVPDDASSNGDVADGSTRQAVPA